MEKQSTRKFLKLFVALVALFLLGSSALLLSSCKEEHTHDWGEGTVTVQPTCTAQGLKTFECSCGAVRTEPIQATGHKWEQEGEPVAPTCTMEGYTLYKCSVCGETEQRDVKPTVVHKFEDVEDECIEPTCTTPGLHVKQCVYCGTYDRYEIPATDHKWDEGTVVQATCVAEGYTLYKCTECGTTKREDYRDPTGVHEWVTVEVIEPSCESGGYTLQQCANCTSTQQINPTDKTDHVYEVLNDPELTHEATCTQAGVKTSACIYCGVRYQDQQYTADHPKLGHAWKANTDADEKEFWGIDTSKKFTITTSTGEKLTYEGLAEAKADGWTVSTEAMCSTDGTLTRKCDRCGETETVTIKAPGHKLDETIAETNKWFVCKAQDNLTDVDGNKYAYICANGDHCDAEVTINAAGDTAHYVAAGAHKLGNYTASQNGDGNHPAATCEKEGYDQATCSVCDYVDYKEVAALGHDANTKQTDGKTPVLICDEDDGLTTAEKAVDAMKAAVKSNCGDDLVKYHEEYNALVEAAKAYFEGDHDKNPAYYCFRCHTFVEAMDHEYVYAALEEGKFELTDYEKDENGKPVAADITDAEFTCQYVKVCKNCGTPERKGDHPENMVTEATCRGGSYCTLCGEQQGAQLKHVYVNVSEIIKTTNAADTKVPGATDYTYGQLRAAYNKVVANEGWMQPDTGKCEEPGKDVAVCITCLLDAADGAEFDWAPKKVEKEEDFDKVVANTATKENVCAYTYEYAAKHSYVKAYFTTDAKAATDGYVSASQYAGRILWQNTNCLFGYKVAYICEDCNKVYSNVPTLDVTGGDDESAKNTDLGHGYTDANGFILDTDGKNMNTNLTQMPDVDMHEADKHAAYVTDDYSKSNGYLASNCVETAVITYCCANCGQKIEAHYGDTTAPIETNTYKEGIPITAEDEKTNFNGDPIVTKNTVAEPDTKVNPKNHKNDTFECGTHCNAYVLGEGGKKLYCSAFDTKHSAGSETTVEIADGDAKLTEAYHDTIIVDFGFSTLVTYDEGYTLKIATVTKDNVSSTANDDSEYEVDWANVKLSVSDKASECMKTGADSDNYTLPTKFTAITDYAGFTGGKYFVVVDAEGKIYPIEDELYIFSHDDIKKTEGQVTSDVTVTQGDKFFIRFSNVAEEEAALPAVPVKAADAASLTEALKRVTADETTKTATVNFAENATVKLDDTNGAAVWEQLNKVKGDTIVFDLNGASIEWAFAGSLSFGNNFYGTDMVMTTGGTRTFKVMNGSIKFTAESGVENMAAFTFGVKDTLTGKIAFVAENMTVDTGAFGTAVEIGYSADYQPSVTLKNTVINAYGTYGIKIDAATGATDPTGENATHAKALTLQGTTVDMKTATGKTTVLSTALFVGAPVAVEVTTNSNLSATGQAVAVRAGSVVLTNSTLTLKSGYTAPTVVNGEPEKGKNQVKFDTLGDTSITELDSWADGTTVQEYRMYGLWSTGNAIPQGVIVVGNSDTTNYQNKAVLDIRGGVNCVTEVDDTHNLVVGSYYGDTMAQTAGVDGAAATPNVCVTLKVVQGFDDIEYCKNFRTKTISLQVGNAAAQIVENQSNVNE